MRFIDMFCGIGGFRLGLEKSGGNWKVADTESLQPQRRKPNSANPSGGTPFAFNCVWANDNDRYACQIYRNHWNDGTLHEGDIKAVDPLAIPEHDLLCAGFPCQDFSIAGKRAGIEGTRGTLFFEICRVLRIKRPGYVFLENVRGLLSADDGRAFGIVLSSLDELGYDCQWQVLNSKNYGVPQNRERVFIIGHLRGKPRPKVFPIGETIEKDRQVSERNTQIAPTLQARDWRGQGKQLDNLMIQVECQQDTGQNIGLELGSKHEPLPCIRAEHHNTADVHFITRDGRDGRSCLRSERALELGIKGLSIRHLTPLECERLQGFPDNWTKGISDTQRYKCLGNAVTVNVIEVIGRALIRGNR